MDKSIKNGKSKQNAAVNSIEIVDKQKMEVELETMLNNIIKYSNQMYSALTKQEKRKCLERVKMLEMSRSMLLEKYEKKYGQKPNINNTITNPNDLEALSQKYPGLQYNVDDPVVRKQIGYSLSYNSGYAGYTEKEAQDIKRLLEL